MESPAFPLPGSSKSARTYSFFLQPASLTGGSHPPSHVLRSFTRLSTLPRQGRKIAASGGRARLSASCPKT